MATPTGERADAARRFHARERRRTKQNQSDYSALIAAPFDFGTVAAGGSSTNVLTLPADIEIAITINAIMAAGHVGVLDVTSGIDFVSAEAAVSGARINIRHLFREPHQIRITRAAGALAGAASVKFRGPKSQLIEIGTAVFT